MIYAKAKKPDKPQPAPPASDPLRREPSPHELREYDDNQRRFWETERRI